jgi:hypothetical protein
MFQASRDRFTTSAFWAAKTTASTMAAKTRLSRIMDLSGRLLAPYLLRAASLRLRTLTSNACPSVGFRRLKWAAASDWPYSPGSKRWFSTSSSDTQKKVQGALRAKHLSKGQGSLRLTAVASRLLAASFPQYRSYWAANIDLLADSSLRA